MAHNYHLTQTGPEVQELLDKIKLATTDEPGLMSAEDKVALDSLVENAYVKPDTGIPKTDLSSGVQTSLDKADTALQEHQDISGKADKVSGATAGDFAGLDSNGNLTDSGSKASDFATAEQGAKADSAYQKPNDGIPASDLADGVLPDVSGKEDVSNKVTSLSALSTDTQYPSAKLVYDQLATKQDVISDLAAIRSGASAGATAYQKPQNGIPASDLASGVIPDVSNFITKTVDDLTNYYLKSETYTKGEVEGLIAAISQFHYEIYASRQDVVSPANNVLYLIGPTGSGTDMYEEYVYDPTKQDPWVKIGDTSIDLSGYVEKVQSTDNAIARFDGTGGAMQDSLVKIDDDGDIISSKAVYLTAISSSVASSVSRLVFGSKSSPYNYISANSSGVFGIYRASDNKGISCYPTENFFSNSNIDLGRSQSLWKNLYLSGTIGNATNRLTIPNKSGTIALVSDLEDFITTAVLNAALAAYTTSADLTTLLAGKQDTISDLATIRSGAAAGAAAYQKPESGIPASDLEDGVIPSVESMTNAEIDSVWNTVMV